MLDTSVSMDSYPAGSSVSRLALAQEALEKLINEYGSSLGKVMVVGFDDSATVFDAGGNIWMSGTQAVNTINNVDTARYTDYDDAISAVRNNYTTPAEGNTVVYFLSDGDPQGSDNGNDNSISNSERNTWVNFLNDPANNITDVHAIAVGAGISDLDQLAKITISGNILDVVVVTNENDLSDTLLEIVDTVSVDGNLLTNDSAGLDGWDSPALVSVQYGSTVYTFSPIIHEFEIDLGNAGSVTVRDNGTFTYDAGESGNSASVQYTVSDSDGSEATATLNLSTTVNHAPVANTDYVVTNIFSDSITVDSDLLTANDTDADGDALSATPTTFTTGWEDLKGGDFTGDGVISFTANDDRNLTISRGEFANNAGNQTASLSIDAKLGTVNGSRDTDTFTLHLLAGEVVTVLASVDFFDDSWFNADIRVSDSAGHVVSEGQNIDYTALTEGDYSITVMNIDDNGGDWGGTSDEDYTLDITIDYSDAHIDGATATDTYTVSDGYGGEDDATVHLTYVDGNTIEGSSSHADIIIGGAGDDNIVYDANDAHIDGGAGYDTLLLQGGTIDFTGIDNIEHIEALDLTQGDNDVTLCMEDVLEMTGSNTIDIAGSHGDSVTVSDSSAYNYNNGVLSDASGNEIHFHGTFDVVNDVSTGNFVINFTDDGTEVN
jgi:hypothetical protein